ncbi:hypothetical protein TASIC1_0005015900 [Trichoderma asperellum]|uniref:Uncharacterized protein n=1 Tax=Trichoderma asperellum TaxID=101201 RepID=A0A6V8QRU9_TRIAP|nr:hypothetical protein LI328DRAFT_85881 [Trichoderma asperelloides]GFP55301.1 hypothetical protein TASIC1_0005015900 [Trichoderma asperellum]
MISSMHLLLLALASSQTAQAFKAFPRDGNNDTESASSKGLPLAAIIGIIVGIVFIFGLATCLFVIYFARQRHSPRPFYEQRYYYRQEIESPKTMVEPWEYVAHQPRYPEFQGVARNGPVETNAEFYNRMESAARSGHIQLTHDPRSAIHGHDNAMPAHHAYDPNTVSKQARSATSSHSLPHPQPTHKRRPGTPDSFIIRAYKSAVEDASRVPEPQPLPTPKHSVLSSPSEPNSSPTLVGSSSRWSSRFSSLSLPKLYIPKKAPPPSLVLQPLATQPRDGADHQLHITPPLLSDPRFIDRPLGAGVVVLERNRPPTPKNSEKYAAYTEVPLASGKSILYGM